MIDDKKLDQALVAHQVLLNSKPPAKTTIKAMREWFLDTKWKIEPHSPTLGQQHGKI
jgi:hypothetical protein